MSQICLADVPRRAYSDCDACVESYVTYTETTYPVVGGQTWACRLTRKYRWRTCHTGLAIGRHVHSITLLPGEEVELEVVRRERFSSALHQQTSVEQELEFEVQETLRDEWSLKSDAEFESTKQNNWKVFGQKRQTINRYLDSVAEFERVMSEVVRKSVASVSSKYETSIDIKTEVENKFRALRKVKNPNRCQPVTFHHYQLMKKIRRELFFVEQTYDCSPPAGIAPPGPGITSYRQGADRPQNLHPDIVARPPQWTLGDPVAASAPAQSCADAKQGQILVSVPFVRPRAKELSKTQALDEVRLGAGDEAAREMQGHLDQIDDIADPSGGGLIFSEEFCVGTDGFHVEGVVSNCSVCDDCDLKLKELECRKAELELEKLKCEIELCHVEVRCKDDDCKKEDDRKDDDDKKEKYKNKK